MAISKAESNRLKDALRDITPSAPDLHPRRWAPPEDEVLLDVKELGLSLPARQKLANLILEHAEVGQRERDAAKEKKSLTAQIKVLLQKEHVSEPTFTCEGLRVSHYTTTRMNLNKDALRDALLNAGVKPAIITSAFEEATSPSDSYTLRITQPGETDGD